MRLRELAASRVQLLIGLPAGDRLDDASARLAGWRQRAAEIDVRLLAIPPAPRGGVALAMFVGDRTYAGRGLVWSRFGLGSVPAAVLVGTTGVIAITPVDDVAEIDGLIDDLVGRNIPARRPPTRLPP